MNVYEVVKKLIGPIRPIGETNTDNINFENLRVMTELVDKLLADIDDVGYSYKDNCQFTMKRASNFARNFQTDIGIIE
ncbi:MAG TPA: hypothetical protein ENH07_10230 [Nitrospirae bacterium]|nr:hypothetical protein [Nitrospirota bacterium]